jgi:hypothetical protein
MVTAEHCMTSQHVRIRFYCRNATGERELLHGKTQLLVYILDNKYYTTPETHHQPPFPEPCPQPPASWIIAARAGFIPAGTAGCC